MHKVCAEGYISTSDKWVLMNRKCMHKACATVYVSIGACGVW